MALHRGLRHRRLQLEMVDVEAEWADGILGENLLGMRGGEISDGAFVVEGQHDLRAELVPAG